MSVYSFLLVLVVFISFAADLVMPGVARLSEMPARLGQVPAYLKGEIRADLVSLYQEGGAVRQQAQAAPALVGSTWREVRFGARLLCAEAGVEAHQLGRHFSTSGVGTSGYSRDQAGALALSLADPGCERKSKRTED
jgi:hypothetical protein